MVLSRLSLHKHIRRLKDPRLNRRKRHLQAGEACLRIDS
jgi:hypothetical protein